MCGIHDAHPLSAAPINDARRTLSDGRVCLEQRSSRVLERVNTARLAPFFNELPPTILDHVAKHHEIVVPAMVHEEEVRL